MLSSDLIVVCVSTLVQCAYVTDPLPLCVCAAVAVGSSFAVPRQTRLQREGWIVGLLILPLLGASLSLYDGYSVAPLSQWMVPLVSINASIMVLIHTPRTSFINIIPLIALLAVCTTTVLCTRGIPVALSRFETSIIFQAIILLGWGCVRAITPTSTEYKFNESIVITEIGVLCVTLIVITLLIIGPILLNMEKCRLISYKASIAVSLAVLCGGIAATAALMHTVVHESPLLWILNFLLDANRNRVRICLAWIVALVLAVYTIPALISAMNLSNTTARKLFHFLAVAMFAPAIHIDIEMISLSFGVALSALLLMEWLRLFCRRHGVIDAVTTFFDQFIDERDAFRGIAVTHLYLLVGCALPVWVTVYLMQAGNKDSPSCFILPHLGWIVIGIGDSSGAIIGKTCGRTKWPGISKTCEGSFGMLVSMLCAAAITSWMSEYSFQGHDMRACIVAMCVATLSEAFTEEIDNLLLPLDKIIDYLFNSSCAQEPLSLLISSKSLITLMSSYWGFFPPLRHFLSNNTVWFMREEGSSFISDDGIASPLKTRLYLRI